MISVNSHCTVTKIIFPSDLYLVSLWPIQQLCQKKGNCERWPDARTLLIIPDDVEWSKSCLQSSRWEMNNNHTEIQPLKLNSALHIAMNWKLYLIVLSSILLYPPITFEQFYLHHIFFHTSKTFLSKKYSHIMQVINENVRLWVPLVGSDVNWSGMLNGFVIISEFRYEWNSNQVK